MNTIKSVWVGWGSLVVACGGAYYFAKRSIDADRRDRYQKMQEQRRYQASLEASYNDPVYSPSSELQDPAPTRHAPETEKQRIAEKSKYEASAPYKSPRGDRFS